jgi:hypothetical protein
MESYVLQNEEISSAFNNPGKKPLSKRRFYKWGILDVPGTFRYLNKYDLYIDPSYQRTGDNKRALDLARNWSWLACGTLQIAKRNNKYYVIDGQHRLMAAVKRDDIDVVPCMVYETDNNTDEAIGWLRANTFRRIPTSIQKFPALIESGNTDALYLKEVCDLLGIKITKNNTNALEMASIKSSLNIIAHNRLRFYKVMSFIAELCVEHPIKEILIIGLDYIEQKFDLNDKILRERLLNIGPKKLITSAQDAAAYYSKGGQKVWANGMLNEVIKKKSKKYLLENKDIFT